MTQLLESPVFTVPARHNPRLQELADRINADAELRQMWRCANVNAVERLGMSDHGEVHVRIVANAALRLLRLLRETGHPAGVVTHHRLSPEDAELVVVLAAALHDLGIATHYDRHPEYSLPLAFIKAKELLTGLYAIREQTIVVSESLHAVATHHGSGRCLTLEAGVLRLADALDMTAGRTRPAGALNPRDDPPTPRAPAAPEGLRRQGPPGKSNGVARRQSPLAPPGAAAVSGDRVVDEVQIRKGEARPVRVEIKINQPVGLPQMEDSLRRTLQGSPLFGLVEIVTRIDDEERTMPLYEMEVA